MSRPGPASIDGLNPIPRLAAAEQGLRFYFTGKPCVRGHLARRYVSIGVCVQCSRENSNRQNDVLRATRRVRGTGKQILVLRGTPEQLATMRATATAFGVTIENTTRSKLVPMPNTWGPPADLVTPVLSQAYPVELRTGGASVWSQLDPQGREETVDVSHLLPSTPPSPPAHPPLPIPPTFKP